MRYGMSVAPPAFLGVDDATRAFMPSSLVLRGMAIELGMSVEALFRQVTGFAHRLGEHLVEVLLTRGWPEEWPAKVVLLREAIFGTLGTDAVVSVSAPEVERRLSSLWACAPEFRMEVLSAPRTWFWTDRFQTLVAGCLPWLHVARVNRLAFWYWARDVSRAEDKTFEDHLLRIARKIDLVVRRPGEIVPDWTQTIPEHHRIGPTPRTGPHVPPPKFGPSDPDAGRDRPEDLPLRETWSSVAVRPPRPEEGGGGILAGLLALGTLLFAMGRR